ncbi:hypothetical protein [Thiocystis violacea]|uniref:hypothetical protein n=1 Tax=Thiocystis violacea TaxID=13725 RepID=UPI0019036298|nr:hypothetical protein [Thiocystis violacea]MBK1716993.1 hypothetical protein [Thiocystis violacea]
MGMTHALNVNPDAIVNEARIAYFSIEIAPLFYSDQERFIDFMRHAIALNGSFFNTQRMVLQYVTKAYLR